MLVVAIEMDSQNLKDCEKNALSSLVELQPSEEAVVRKILGSGTTFVRLLEMGFVPGVRVRMIKRAPLGDPFELQIHGYHVSLRRSEADQVCVCMQSSQEWEAAE